MNGACARREILATLNFERFGVTPCREERELTDGSDQHLAVSHARALARNKMRSFLTMLGVIIGVGAVIASVAVGEGASNRIQEQISNLGDNMIWVEAGGRAVNGVLHRHARDQDPGYGRQKGNAAAGVPSLVYCIPVT